MEPETKVFIEEIYETVRWLAGCILIYFGASFILMDFNPFNWGLFFRLFFLAALVAYTIAFGREELDDDEG